MTLSHEILPGEVDCLIIGGGISGAGIARDVAMRGLSLLLVECNDFASGTSHLTSKVIHGGLRYLEHGHIRPVVEGIVERHRLLTRVAPNLVRPLKFVMPFEGHRFPKWLATLCGLQLYGLPEWYSGSRGSAPMLGVRLRRDYPTMRPHPFAVTFWDAQADDARLVMATLRTAQREGAVISNYTSITGARFDDGSWTVRVSLEGHGSESEVRTVRARAIVNATGPWSPLTAELLGNAATKLLWIKGSHILFPRPPRFGDDAIVIRSVRDLRPLWVIPWHNRLIVGTTERQYEGDLRAVRATSEEIDDLFESFAHFFPAIGFQQGDIRCAFAGVRPIIPQTTESANRLSREHRVDVDFDRRAVSVLGGKLTTFRRIAEQVGDEVDRLLGHPPPTPELRHRLRTELLWPDLTPTENKRLRANLAGHLPGDADTGADIIDHLIRHYGWDALLILEEATSRHRFMGRGPSVVGRRPSVGSGGRLFEGLPYTLAELAYLCRTEKVCHLIDLVKRRAPLYFLVDHAGLESLPLVVRHVAPILGWDEGRQERELSAVADEFRADMAACAAYQVSPRASKEPLPDRQPRTGSRAG